MSVGILFVPACIITCDGEIVVSRCLSLRNKRETGFSHWGAYVRSPDMVTWDVTPVLFSFLHIVAVTFFLAVPFI